MYKKNFLLVFLLTVLLFNIAAERPKVALVLGGGGALGFAHIAVLELLEEMEIPVDMVIGVSAGAIAGGLYSAGYSPEMIKFALLSMDWADLFLDAPVMPFENELDSGDFLFRFNLRKGEGGKGLSPGQEVYNLFKTLTAKIPSYIEFDSLPIPFRAGVAEMSGKNFELLERGDLAEAIRASMSLPAVFDSFNIDGKSYIDGGVLNNLPIRMAREMGYDIVIACELSNEPESLTDDPLKVPLLMLDLYTNVVSSAQYDLADVLIKPDLSDYFTMDFHKSFEIYSVMRAERDKMYEEFLKIKERLSAEDTVFVPSGSYRDLPHFSADIMTIAGEQRRDRELIEKYFSDHLKGKKLEEESIADFIRNIYETGNYRSVVTRIDPRNNNTILELRLQPDNFNITDLLLGGYYHGTFSNDSLNKVSVQSGIQIKGLSGPGSVLSLKASIIDVISIGALYLQPLSAKTFMSAKMDVILDTHISSSGFFVKGAEEERLFLVSAEINGGIYFNKRNLLKAGTFILSTNPQNSAGEDGRNTAWGFSTLYTYNSLDYLFLPSKGIYASLENHLYLPLPFRSPALLDILSLELQGVFPIDRRFSISAGAFGGTDLSLNLSDLDGLIVGFTTFDRQFFPNVSGRHNYYAHKVAGSLSLQFQPLKDLNVFGGLVLFSYSVSAGQVFNGTEDFDIDRTIWNTSLNVGVRLKNNFGILLRTGIGGNGSGSVRPFIAFDIGQRRRSGIR